MSFNEHPLTYQARKKLKKLFYDWNYNEIEEEVPLETVTNNMEEELFPPYRADILVTKTFIIELDPQSDRKYKSKGHGTKKRRIHDQWRDKNIKNQINLKTVRLVPEEILKQSPEEILNEINYQLKQNKWEE